MNKLKTLNELWKETETLNISYEGNSVHALRQVDFAIIRKEAIKWIKEIEENGFKADKPPNAFFLELRGERERIIRFIKYFFNLTEKDLEE